VGQASSALSPVQHHCIQDSRAQSLAPLSPSFADFLTPPSPTRPFVHARFRLEQGSLTILAELPLLIHSSDGPVFDLAEVLFVVSSFSLRLKLSRITLFVQSFTASNNQLRNYPAPPVTERSTSYKKPWLHSLLRSPRQLIFLPPAPFQVGRAQCLLSATTQRDLAEAARPAQSST
jgi:hypothetical protein